MCSKKIKKGLSQLFYILKNIKKIKIFIVWIKSLLKKKNNIIPSTPWIVVESIEKINKIVNKNSYVFEWGSGGSTFYFSNLAKEIISVEHDKQWFLNIKNEILKRGISNCKYFFQEAEKNILYEGVDDVFLSTDINYLGMNFKKYCDVINSYPDNYFDLILIDGRARNGCIKNAISKLKFGGFIVLDNSDRECYLSGKKMLKNFKEDRFYGPCIFNLSFGETTIFKKII